MIASDSFTADISPNGQLCDIWRLTAHGKKSEAMGALFLLTREDLMDLTWLIGEARDEMWKRQND